MTPSRGGWGALIAAKLVCCGGLLLLVTGVLTVKGIGTWLLGGGAVWLFSGGLAVTLFVLWRRRRNDQVPSDGRSGAVDEAASLSGHRVPKMGAWVPINASWYQAGDLTFARARDLAINLRNPIFISRLAPANPVTAEPSGIVKKRQPDLPRTPR